MSVGQIEFAGLMVFSAAIAVRAAWRHLTNQGHVPARNQIRRGGANAMLVLDEFVAPQVEHVIQARQQRNENDSEAGNDDDPAVLAARVRSGLACDPVDIEEIRRLLTLAQRNGLDWRVLFDEAVRAETASRPYRAPFLPPASRVAPRG